MKTPNWEKIQGKLHQARKFVGEFIYGATTYEWAKEMARERGHVERLFVLITFGDLLGVPILPPYYTLRLLPYVVPSVERWKRSMLRERDVTDLADLIEGAH